MPLDALRLYWFSNTRNCLNQYPSQWSSHSFLLGKSYKLNYVGLFMVSLLPAVRVVYTVTVAEKQTVALLAVIIKSHEIQYEWFYVHLIEKMLHKVTQHWKSNEITYFTAFFAPSLSVKVNSGKPNYIMQRQVCALYIYPFISLPLSPSLYPSLSPSHWVGNPHDSSPSYAPKQY